MVCQLSHFALLRAQGWYPQGDLNPCFWNESPVSWTGLDDGGTEKDWLRNLDSNQDYLIQSQACCRCTIPQHLPEYRLLGGLCQVAAGAEAAPAASEGRKRVKFWTLTMPANIMARAACAVGFALNWAWRSSG